MNTDAYQPHRDRYDEMLAADGAARAHWRPLLNHLREATPAQMRQRQEFVRSQVLENGVTYNMYASTQGAGRPWELDPLPLLLPAAEWSRLAAAVAQRARLLDAVLADLYGPQALLCEGLLPPATVYGHPDFLWPCRGLQPPGGRFLHLYAVDLARSADGHWWVIGDRSQAPSGAGYALENRLIVSRAFPELFRDQKVQHLAEFFRALRQNLLRHAPSEGEQPLTVLLTPGPFNETYFEHAYLARYLGFPLVEGQDLTVRGETLYLKTLTGLQRVHAVLRRLDDDYCDPLELRGDSALGVPGLLQVARAGRVLIANAPGSGLVESGAIAAFLPRICERLLGEKLALPAVASWWCGEAPALEYVIAHLDELVIKPAYPSTSHHPVLGRDLRGKAREALILRLRKQPRAWVAQEIVRLSQAPVMSHEHHLAARPVGLRMYATADADGGYAVMPGGLARVAGTPVAQMISMQRGGGSKDTWVLSETAVSSFSLLAHTVTAQGLLRSPSNLSSRVVENLFWFGRYTTRCDAHARLLRATLMRIVDAGAEALAARDSALALCRGMQLLAAPDEGSPEPAPEDALWAAISDENPQNLAANLRRLAWTGMQIREHLSLDNWLVLQRLPRAPTAEARHTAGLGVALDYLDCSLTFCVGLAGFAMDGMTRDNGWRFLMIGRHLERLAFIASATARFLHRGLAHGWSSLDWLLEVADSSITYRGRYRAQAELLPLLDLIVFDASNPHGVAFQLRQLLAYLGELSADLGGSHHDVADEAQALLQDYIRFDLARLERADAASCRALANLLERTAHAAWALSDTLAARHFTHVGEISRQTLAA